MPTQHELTQQISALSEKVALLGQSVALQQDQIRVMTALAQSSDKEIARIQTKLAMVAGLSSIAGGLLVTFVKTLLHA